MPPPPPTTLPFHIYRKCLATELCMNKNNFVTLPETHLLKLHVYTRFRRCHYLGQSETGIRILHTAWPSIRGPIHLV